MSIVPLEAEEPSNVKAVMEEPMQAAAEPPPLIAKGAKGTKEAMLRTASVVAIVSKWQALCERGEEESSPVQWISAEMKEKSLTGPHDDRIRKPGLCHRAKYIVSGTWDNSRNKHRFLKMRSELKVLSKKTTALVDQLFDLEMRLGMNPLTGSHHEPFVLNYDQEVVDMLKIINAFLIEFNEMLWCTHCPMTLFLQDYMIRREHILTHGQNDTVSMAVLKLKVREITRIISELEVLGDYVKIQLDNLDQNPFKLFLVFFNLLCWCGSYIWTGFLYPAATCSDEAANHMPWC